MKSIYKDLISEREYYAKILNKLGNVSDERKGHLLIYKKDKHLEYYQYIKIAGVKKRKYLGCKVNDQVKNLAEGTYKAKVKKYVIKRLKILDAAIEEYEKDYIDKFYEDLSPERKEIFDPIIPTEKQRLEAWKNAKYRGNPYEFDQDSPIYTNNGERVRSKSEKILADLFKKYNIPYKYECPLTLKNGEVIYPDFTFINPRTGQEMYWEHFGMMDDPKYVAKTMARIRSYQLNGLTLGNGLIATFESKSNVLDYREAEMLIEKYLI